MRYNWRPMESFLTSAGYGALILFGFLEACCVPISSEITFGFAGVLAYQGHLSLALVIIIGSLAELAGSCHILCRGPLGRPPAGRQGGAVRADHPLRRGPGRTVPGGPGGLGRSRGPDDSRRARLHLDRRRPHRDAAGPVRGPQRDRHRHLRVGASPPSATRSAAPGTASPRTSPSSATSWWSWSSRPSSASSSSGCVRSAGRPPAAREASPAAAARRRPAARRADGTPPPAGPPAAGPSSRTVPTAGTDGRTGADRG